MQDGRSTPEGPKYGCSVRLRLRFKLQNDHGFSEFLSKTFSKHFTRSIKVTSL